MAMHYNLCITNDTFRTQLLENI